MVNVSPQRKFYNNVIKRVLDIILSATVMILFSWLYAIIAVLVKLNLGSPVIFVHERPGRIDPKTGKERIFRLYKYRSMTNDLDENGVLLSGAQRVTKFGSILRSTSLDEIPELWNILRGDMSFIGPRPLHKKALDYYTERERRRHVVRPGLTGLAQVNGRNVASWDERFGFDLYYVRNVSLALDIKIFFKTLIKVFNQEDIVDSGKH